MLNKNNLNIGARIAEPSPRFFRKLRNAGLMLAAVGGAILSAPFTLPAAVVSVAGYLATAGLVASAVSAATVKNEGE